MISVLVTGLIAWRQNAQLHRRWLLDRKWDTYTRIVSGLDANAELFAGKRLTTSRRKAMDQGLSLMRSEFALLLPKKIVDNEVDAVMEALNADRFVLADYQSAMGYLLVALRRDLGVKIGG